jgi:hypothetical protein
MAFKKGFLATRGCTRLVSIRLPRELESAIKEAARIRERPWQTVLKELLVESLGLSDSLIEVKRVPAKNLRATLKRLKRG